MDWRKVIMRDYCARCDKLIKPGRYVATAGGRTYCYRCGHNLELAGFHRVYGKLDRQAASHLRAIGSGLKKVVPAGTEHQKGGAGK